MNEQTVLLVLSTVWAFLVKAWSGIGPLVGVLIGSWLGRSWQRKQWELDNKRTEYRELIGTLSKSFHYIATYRTVVVRPPEVQRGLLEAEVAGQQVIADRIFIDKQLREAQVSELWGLIAAENDFGKLWEYWETLHALLVKMAHQDLRIET